MASNTANHLSLEYKTENELRFAQWAMREYGMTNKERTTHTFKGQMSVLLEVWNVVDIITLPISLVSAGGKFIGKEVAKEVAEELGEKAVKEVAKEAVEKTVKREVAEEAVEKTVKTEVSEEIAESAAKKELVDTAEDLSQKTVDKNDVLEGRKIIEKKIRPPIFRKASQEDVNLIADIKKRYNAGKTRNAAKARGTINGETMDLECISGKFTQNDYFNKGNFEPPLPDKYHYKGPIPEYINHTEQKIIEYLREKLKNTPEVSGEIEIISERIFCDNYKAIVDMFEEEFPNIKVIRVEVNK